MCLLVRTEGPGLPAEFMTIGLHLEMQTAMSQNVFKSFQASLLIRNFHAEIIQRVDIYSNKTYYYFIEMSSLPF